MQFALAAGLTIVVETLILVAAGYRTWRFVVVCIAINLATNLTLNVGLAFLTPPTYYAVLYPAEVAVVLIEWATLRLVADDGRTARWRTGGARLLLFVFIANLASFLLGVALFW